MHGTVLFSIYQEADVPPLPEHLLPKRRSDVHNHALRHTTHAARSLGHRVEIATLELASSVTRYFRELLIVNGHLCSFQCSSNRFTNPLAKRSYTKTMVTHTTLVMVEYAIFCTVVPDALPHIFVLPRTVLESAYFDPPRDHATLWLPVEQRPNYKNMHGKIPYWEYENAWPKAV